MPTADSRVAPDQLKAMLAGAPKWVSNDNYAIHAKASGPVRALLVDRFKLVTHTGTTPLPAFVLSMGKGAPKMKQADDSSGPGCQFQPPTKDAPPEVINNLTFSCHNMSMDAFVSFLRQTASPYLRKPAVDSTGLKGSWDFDIHWTYQPPKGDAQGITIFDAIDIFDRNVRITIPVSDRNLAASSQ
jgi:uncharacterized protein (TIGR03435 family)